MTARDRTRSMRAILFVTLALSATRPASAQEAEEPSATGRGDGGATAAASRVDDPDLEWWPWLATVPLLATTLVVDVAVPSDAPRWSRFGPMDRAFSSWARDTIEGRRRAARASDIFLLATAAAPLVDAISWNQAGTSRSRVTYRLLTVDSLGFALQGLLSVSLKHALRRPRPYVASCEADPAHDPGCDSSSRFQSFTSGHAAAAFTGAALVCAHQRLRGRTLLGHIECATALAFASFTGALRIVAERHYVSDVIGGALIGLISGYLLPLLLYPRQLPAPRGEQPTAW